MTATARPRPSATMTQVVRPSCEVHALPEVHSYLGPGINNFGSPCLMEAPFALWWSEGTAWDVAADTSAKSATVFAANDPLLKQGSKASGRKHHIIIAAGSSLLPPAPIAVWGAHQGNLPGEWVDPVSRDNGESTAIFAPRHVSADIDGRNEIATIRFFGGSSMGALNFAVCCDPVDHPLTFCTQTPNTVFLGMTMADTMGSAIAFAISAIANGIVKMLVERVVGWFSKAAARYISRLIGRVASTAIRYLLRLARWAGVFTVDTAGAAAIDSTLEAFFNMPGGRFDHTSIDDGIADLWDEYVVSP